MTYFQTDAHGLFCGQTPYQEKGFGDVVVAPPSTIPAGKVARWVSRLETLDIQYGDANTGEWQLVEDNRQATLYTPDGPYTLGESYFGQTYDGLGVLPPWLSVESGPEVEPSLEQLREQQLTLVNAGFESAVSELTAGYPATERLTWPVQQAEALAWSKDSSIATPYLDGIATARGISLDEMREKTLTQVRSFLELTQHLIGVRQGLRDQIDAAVSEEAVKAIVWPVSGAQA
ncbi:hypothetical protein [Alcaligenes sp. SMD-FA]|uniref:hypothetical protein n=1 Tax=Alcaligenes sp. SMD-FA TaxID=2991054 RepID=UPI002226D7A0|nr:hypothetical protein [Alcaligenes sp. SMD-FA]UYY88610.1 hypothetical protein OKX01_06905 [Alcaligenes sp. SMD-FA]